jgi:hypothetical protein
MIWARVWEKIGEKKCKWITFMPPYYKYYPPECGYLTE